MLRLDVRSNIRQIVSELGTRDPIMIKRATSSALNKGMAKSQSVAVKAAAKSLRVAQKWIRGRMKRTGARQSRLIAAVTFNPRGLNPLKLGYTPGSALKFYTGRRVGQPFVMTMPNGSRQIVVRLPASQNPNPERGPNGQRRKGRLPVASIRIFIGRKTIKEFEDAMAIEGEAAFEKEFYRYLQANWPRR